MLQVHLEEHDGVRPTLDRIFHPGIPGYKIFGTVDRGYPIDYRPSVDTPCVEWMSRDGTTIIYPISPGEEKILDPQTLTWVDNPVREDRH